MTDNNHTEEIGKEVARLFKEAHKIEPGRAEWVVHNSLHATDKEKRDLLKNVISGEFSATMKAGDASEKLDQLLMRLRMLGDLLDTTSGSSMDPDPSTMGVAGGLIWEWTEEARKARSLLAGRWSDLEGRCDYRATPVDGGAS